MINDVMEWRNSLYCVELNASHSIRELRVLIEGFEFHVYAHLSPTFTELLILRVCSSSSSASLLPIFILVLFSTSIPKTMFRYACYFQGSRIAFFLIDGTCSLCTNV